MRRSLRAIVATSAVAAVAFGSLLAVPAAQAADNKIVIWTDADRAPAIRYLFPNGYKGVPVEVVVKPFEELRDSLSKVTADAAPDVAIGANDCSTAPRSPSRTSRSSRMRTSSRSSRPPSRTFRPRRWR